MRRIVTDMPKGTFLYVDKGRIKDFLENQIRLHEEMGNPTDKAVARALRLVLDRMNAGFFDWQQGSE